MSGEQLYALVLVELGLEIAPELQPVTNLAIRCFLCLACRVTALWQSGDLLMREEGSGLTFWVSLTGSRASVLLEWSKPLMLGDGCALVATQTLART